VVSVSGWRMNKVTLHQAQLVLGWFDNHTIIAFIKETRFIASTVMSVILIYNSLIALVLHFLFILISSYLTLLLSTLWHLIAYNMLMCR